MHTATGRPSEPVRRVVSSVLETSVRSWRRPTVGSVAETFLLDLEGDPERVVCKVGGASVWTGDVIEPTVCRLVRERTALPVPAVIASGRFAAGSAANERSSPDGADDPLSRWALYEFVDGEPPEPWDERCDRTTRRRIVADAGSVLGRLHARSATAFPFDRTGGLVRAPDRPTGLRTRDPTPPSVVDALDDASRWLPWEPPSFRAVLCHGDFHPGNLLVDADGSITAVLDWGNAHVAPAEYAVARAEARFVDRFRSFSTDERTALKRAFRDRYREYAPLAADYPDRAPLYEGLWLAQSGLNLATVARTSRGRTQLRRQLRTVLER